MERSVTADCEWVICRKGAGLATRPTRAEAIGYAVTEAISWTAAETAKAWMKTEEV